MARAHLGRRRPDGRFHGAFVNGDDALGWIADDGRRRGDDAPVLVAHSTPDVRRRSTSPSPAGPAPPMVAALRGCWASPEPDGTHVHRWSLARPTGERARPFR